MSPIRPDDYDPLVALCRAVGNSLQLNVLRALANSSFGVLGLMQIFVIGRSGTNHHSKMLTQAGLVATRHEGNAVFYRRSLLLAERTDGALHAALLEGVDERALPDNARVRTDTVHAQRVTVSQNFFARAADKFQAQQDLIAGLPQYCESVLALLGALVLAPGATALEVDPGDGGFLPELARCSCQVTMLNNSTVVLELAHRHCKEEGLDNVRLESADALQDAAESADCVMLNMTLHHFTASAEALKQLTRLVHSGGSLLVTDLCRHNRGQAGEACGDLRLDFEREDLAQWAGAAGLTPSESFYISLRNGSQIQVWYFVRDTSESRLTHR